MIHVIVPSLTLSLLGACSESLFYKSVPPSNVCWLLLQILKLVLLAQQFLFVLVSSASEVMFYLAFVHFSVRLQLQFKTANCIFMKSLPEMCLWTSKSF